MPPDSTTVIAIWQRGQSMKISSRHHLRNDEIKALRERIHENSGITLEADHFERVILDDSHVEIVLVDGAPNIATFNGEYFLTVTGANEYEPTKRRVTVDSGAISFVSDGADVMRPGIVSTDPSIEPDDLVYIDEETHRKVLGIGRALTSGDDMIGSAGKVVESIHHVGDELFRFNP